MIENKFINNSLDPIKKIDVDMEIKDIKEIIKKDLSKELDSIKNSENRKRALLKAIKRNKT